MWLCFFVGLAGTRLISLIISTRPPKIVTPATARASGTSTGSSAPWGPFSCLSRSRVRFLYLFGWLGGVCLCGGCVHPVASMGGDGCGMCIVQLIIAHTHTYRRLHRPPARGARGGGGRHQGPSRHAIATAGRTFQTHIHSTARPTTSTNQSPPVHNTPPNNNTIPHTTAHPPPSRADRPPPNLPPRRAGGEEQTQQEATTTTAITTNHPHFLLPPLRPPPPPPPVPLPGVVPFPGPRRVRARPRGPAFPVAVPRPVGGRGWGAASPVAAEQGWVIYVWICGCIWHSFDKWFQIQYTYINTNNNTQPPTLRGLGDGRR